MFRAFSLVLVLVLCTSGWSTAHAAPPSITPITEMLSGWKLKNFTKLHRETPIKLGKKAEFDEIGLSHLAWPFGVCAAWESCKHFFWGNNDHKDPDRELK